MQDGRSAASSRPVCSVKEQRYRVSDPVVLSDAARGRVRQRERERGGELKVSAADSVEENQKLKCLAI